MLPISICIIAKNEEIHIEKCLKSLSELDWEIILVDTGSSDSTVQLASAYTSKIYSFEWIDDFSATRNFAISKASNDWILTIDCDEYLTDLDETAFVNWFRGFYESSPSQTILGSFTIHNISASFDNTERTKEQVTRFFNRRYYHYVGEVHEQLLPFTGLKGPVISIPLTFLHMGYASEEVRLQKAERNLNLLLKQLDQGQNDCYRFYQIGQCFFSVKQYEDAFFYFERALELLPNTFPHYIEKLLISYGYSCLELKMQQKAMLLLEKNIYGHFSNTADYLFLAGLICMNNGMFPEAIKEFTKATETVQYSAEGVNSYKAYYNIGVIYECTLNIELAKKFYQKCDSYQPAISRLKVLTEK